MPVRNCGIRDISEITGCSRYKVQKVLKTSQYHVLPKKNHYDTLEIDEIWTFVGSKKNRWWPEKYAGLDKAIVDVVKS